MKQIIAMVVFLYLLFAYSLFAMADDFGKSMPPPTNKVFEVPATLKTDPVQEIDIGRYKAVFEKTKLSEIRDAIGVGSIRHAGEAAENQYWLCYSLPDQTIWFISHGEMGGVDHRLTQVRAIRMNSAHHEDAACPRVPARFQSISMRFGWIGTTRAAIFESLGQPSGTQDGRLIYHYAGKKPGMYYGRTVEWDVNGYVVAVIVDNKISSLYVSHVTSY